MTTLHETAELVTHDDSEGTYGRRTKRTSSKKSLYKAKKAVLGQHYKLMLMISVGMTVY